MPEPSFKLPEAGSEAHFACIQRWINCCNINHNHTNIFMAKLPRRVLDVQGSLGSSKTRLFDTKGCAIGRYITLSHRWGAGCKKSATTKSNLAGRMKGIDVTSLPKTFQDTVKVAHMLGIQFVWIDSLCIVQDDPMDWARESLQMEKIYSSAYFTIAIHSTTDIQGFLYRDSRFHTPCYGDDGEVVGYERNEFSSFFTDVDSSILSQRAWVLQERILSRRTVHFTASQTHWECGSAKWSETSFSQLYPIISWSILGYSDFPNKGAYFSSRSRRQDLKPVFTALFERYSALELTQPTDRPIAIAGLEFRLSSFYGTASVYGIIEEYFLESLLWARHRDATSFKRIIDLSLPDAVFHSGEDTESKLNDGPWAPGARVKEKVPSWSWMAYTGAIKYVLVDEKQSLSRQTTRNDRQGSSSPQISLEFLYSWTGFCTLHANLLHFSVISNETTIMFVRSRGGLCLKTNRNDLVGYIQFDCPPAAQYHHSMLETLGIVEILKDDSLQPWENAFDVGDDKNIQGITSGCTKEYSYALVVEKTKVSIEKRHLIDQGDLSYRRIGIGCINTDFLHATNKGIFVY